MPGLGAQEGKSGDTWLSGEYLAPSSLRRHSSVQTGMKMPKHSVNVKKKTLLDLHSIKIENQSFLTVTRASFNGLTTNDVQLTFT